MRAFGHLPASGRAGVHGGGCESQPVCVPPPPRGNPPSPPCCDQGGGQGVGAVIVTPPPKHHPHRGTRGQGWGHRSCQRLGLRKKQHQKGGNGKRGAGGGSTRCGGAASVSPPWDVSPGLGRIWGSAAVAAAGKGGRGGGGRRKKPRGRRGGGAEPAGRGLLPWGRQQPCPTPAPCPQILSTQGGSAGDPQGQGCRMGCDCPPGEGAPWKHPLITTARYPKHCRELTLCAKIGRGSRVSSGLCRDPPQPGT